METNCGGCHLHSLCGMKEGCEGAKPNARAIVFAYVVPFVLLVAGVVVAHVAGLADGWSALTGIGAVAVYYGLFIKRVKI